MIGENTVARPGTRRCAVHAPARYPLATLERLASTISGVAVETRSERRSTMTYERLCITENRCHCLMTRRSTLKSNSNATLPTTRCGCSARASKVTYAARPRTACWRIPTPTPKQEAPPWHAHFPPLAPYRRHVVSSLPRSSGETREQW